MAVQFFLPWYRSSGVKRNGNVPTFIWRCLAGATAIAVCNIVPNSGKRAYDLHPPVALTSIALEPHEIDVGVSVMYLPVHLGQIAAAYTRRNCTEAAKRLR